MRRGRLKGGGGSGRAGSGRILDSLELVVEKTAYLANMEIAIIDDANKYGPLPGDVENSSEAEIVAIFGLGGFIT